MADSGILKVADYNIPITKQEYNTNFADTLPNTMRVVGMDGGIDIDGDDASPTQIGRVQFGFWLIARTRSEMEALRDQVKALSSLGRQKITFQPTNPVLLARYLYGKVNYIAMPEQKGMHTDLRQRVQLTIQAPEPVWKSSAGHDWSVCDDGSGSFEIADGTYTLDHNALEETFTSTPHNVVIDYPGSATAFPTLALTAAAGSDRALTDWAIKRTVNGQVRDEVRYADTIWIDPENSKPTEFTVDAARKLALWNGKRAFGDNFYYRHPDLMRLVPRGTSEATQITLTITGTVTGTTGNLILRIWYEDTWR